MSTKLTLSLDKEIIEKAKEYAREHKVSLSYLVENYLGPLPHLVGWVSFRDAIYRVIHCGFGSSASLVYC